MNSSVVKSNSGRPSQYSDAVFSSRLTKNTESLASLNIIDEGTVSSINQFNMTDLIWGSFKVDADESPRSNERNNLSGLKPLDDTMDGTVILRVILWMLYVESFSRYLINFFFFQQRIEEQILPRRDLLYHDPAQLP